MFHVLCLEYYVDKPYHFLFHHNHQLHHHNHIFYTILGDSTLVQLIHAIAVFFLHLITTSISEKWLKPNFKILSNLILSNGRQWSKEDLYLSNSRSPSYYREPGH